MPHRTPFGVLRGEPKKDDASESRFRELGAESQDMSTEDVSQTSKTADAPISPRSNPQLQETLQQANGDGDFERSEVSKRTDSPDRGSTVRLLTENSPEQGLWRQAWEDLRGELEKMLPSEIQSVGSMDTLSQVREVHNEAQKRAEFAENNKKLIPGTKKSFREIYGKVARCANEFQIVGNMLSQAEPVYAALPWALIQFGLQCAVGEDEAYHTMLSGIELVSDLVSQYRALENLYARIDSKPSQKLRKSLVGFYQTILRFQVHAINYFDQGKKGRRTLIGFNPITHGDIQQRQHEIDDFKRQVDADAAIVSYEVGKNGIDNLTVSQEGQDKQLEAIKEGIIALAGNTGEAFRSLSKDQEERNRVLIAMWKEPLDDLRTEIEIREINKAKDNLHHVRDWLSVAKPRGDLEAAGEKRHMPLGDWLLNHQKLQRWQSSEHSSMLWLFGFAGTGKTGLVCRVIRHLEEYSQKAGRMAFFFCSNDKAKAGSQEAFSRSDPDEVLRSIVSQLTTSQESNYVAPILQSKYDTFGPNSDQSMSLPYADCIEILIAIAETIPITIILDAFDECDQDRSPRLVQHLQEVIRRSPNVKVFISTRAFTGIEDNLVPDRSIEVTAANNGSDVRTFIRTTLDQRITDKTLLNGQVPDDLKQEIEVTLTDRASNMFLYASLLLNQLCDKKHDDAASVRKKLESLPRDLTDVYSRIMVEIHNDDVGTERIRSIAQNTFKWLLCAQEPLQCDELLEAISPPERKAKHEEVIRSCRTLVVKGRDNYEFAHYSVREHIGQMEDYKPSKCHLVATQSCLTILDKSFGTGKSRDGLSDAEVSFEQYALLYWPLHYEGIRQEDLRDHRATINSLLRSLLLQGRSQRDKYHEWFEEVRKKEKKLKENKYLATKLGALSVSPLSPLFAACVFGLEDLIAKFGRELDGLNKVNDSGQSALCLAIENNKLEVVKALLTRRFPADPNLLNVKAVEQFDDWDKKSLNDDDFVIYASAMQCAAANGRFEIAQYLIEQGAHIDLVAGLYGSPLQAAALKGHAAIVELLLQRGAEPNSQGGFHGNALQAAAAAGHITIINLLLENKPPALVNTPGGHFGSALRAAIHSGNTDTVWALLEEKANPNVESRGRVPLLEEAASMGSTRKDIVSDLIHAKSEADLSPKGDGIHIMHRAAMYGMTELVEYCIRKGCQIDMVTTQGPAYHRRFNDFPDEMTPLGYACAEGHLDIVQLLLDHGAPFQEDRPKSAVLWTAAYQGHADVVDLLLRRFKETHAAEETARFLLQRPHPRSGHPIVWAGASSGDDDVVEVLLNHGAKYESNWFDATPLHATATFGCASVTELLLDYHKTKALDVCINHQTKNGRTALYQACSSKQPVIARMLLDAGADYRITEKDNTTPLQVACFHGLFRVVVAIVETASRELERAEFLKFINTQHHPTGNVALMDCSERNRFACLELLLRHGADYTVPGNGNYTILHLATRHDNSAVMAAIVDRAAQDLERQRFIDFLNTRHSTGKTALIDCAERNRPEAANILLRNGADYIISGHAGNTPLHWACIGGYPELARAILKQAKSENSQTSFLLYINRRNGKGITPLMHASSRNFVSVVDILLSYGVDYTLSRSPEGVPAITALHEACFNGSFEVAKLLLEKASRELNQEQFLRFINARNIMMKTPLYDAADTGRLSIVEFLLSMGADFTITDENEALPQHVASWNGHLEVATLLLETASQRLEQERFIEYLNKRNSQGKTPLRHAAENGKLPILKLMLSRNADYITGNDGNVTPLHVASFLGRTDIVAALLEHAFKDQDRERYQLFLNYRNRFQKTPLWDACHTGQPVIARLLLEHGADYSIANDQSETPLHAASWNGRPKVASVLLKHGSKDENRERFTSFLNKRNKQGKTALMDACQSGRPEIARSLLDYGADYTVRDQDGFTALHYCSHRNRINCVRILLESAARDPQFERFTTFLNQTSDTNRASALRDAVREGHLDVVKLLLEYKPDYHAADRGKRTTLHHAVATGKAELIKLILEYAGKDNNRDRFKSFVYAKDEQGNTIWKGYNGKGELKVAEVDMHDRDAIA